MENGSTGPHAQLILNSDGGKDRESPESRGTDANREDEGLLPRDVACRVFGSDPARTARSENYGRPELAKLERRALATAGLIPTVGFPRTLDAKGTEHSVRFRGNRVAKHQHSDGWVPNVTASGRIGLARALPSEYLRRLELHNALFGDDIRVVGLTRGGRFAITQPTLRGGEPSENEIRDVLEDAGWQRIPIGLQELPFDLMGSAWWHSGEELVLLDARKPNFKKTDFGVLPIDLILADLTRPMSDVLE